MKPEILKHYIGTGLKGFRKELGELITSELIGVFNDHVMLIDAKYGASEIPAVNFKPIVRKLQDLDKPITVEGYNDGKEFVPIQYIIDKLMGIGEYHCKKWEDSDFAVYDNLDTLNPEFFITDDGELDSSIRYDFVIELVNLKFWIGPQSDFTNNLVIDKNSLH